MLWLDCKVFDEICDDVILYLERGVGFVILKFKLKLDGMFFGFFWLYMMIKW